MTRNDIDNERLIGLIGMAPAKPPEFAIFRIGRIRQFTSSSSSNRIFFSALRGLPAKIRRPAQPSPNAKEVNGDRRAAHRARAVHSDARQRSARRD
jgi:hypothetical protein